MTTDLRLAVDSTDGAARTGAITTPRGSFRTPCFMPVGTRATVKAMSTADLADIGFEVMLSNTYHLMLRPGAEVIRDLGGIHGFSAWDGHVLTDSGGYQVFSLEPEVDDDGATFRSTYDGSRHRLTPERAIDLQQDLGADIAMVLDVCPPLPSPPEVIRLAVERTAAWAARSRRHHSRADQALFGIVQGGVDEALRRESAERTAELDFAGYGIGGLSVGEPRHEMFPALAAAIAVLPPERPRYVMGLGDPVGLVECIALGADLFDCVLPTRLARHGSVLTTVEGRLQLRNQRFAADAGPIDESCPCATCRRYSRAYLRHLLQVGEPTALRLLTWHNLAWTLALITRVRTAIEAGDLDRVRREVAEVWG